DGEHDATDAQRVHGCVRRSSGRRRRVKLDQLEPAVAVQSLGDGASAALSTQYAQWRRAVMIQARELNQTPSSLRCAESVSRRRPSAADAAVGSSRLSISLVQVKPRTQSRAAATSGP